MKNLINSNLAKDLLNEYNKLAKVYINNYFKKLIKEIHIPDIEIKYFIINELSGYVNRGKKLRGALTDLGYKLAGGANISKIMELSIAIEIFHAGLLAHDDIMDRDDQRRGIDSLHKRLIRIPNIECSNREHLGLSLAILLGDLAYYCTTRIFSEANLEPNKYKDIMNIFSHTAVRIAYGQIMDIIPRKISEINQEQIIRTIQYKTTEYTGYIPLVIGAKLADFPDDEIQKLGIYGMNLGWAMQIQDDILGIFGDEKTLGKPIGSDIREGKITLLQYKLYKKASFVDRKTQLKLLGKSVITKNDINKMKDLLIKYKVDQEVKKIGWDYVNKAIEITENINTTDKYRKILKSLAYYMMDRLS